MFSVCWLRRSIPKSAPAHFFFFKKPQTMIHIKSYLMFFLTTVTIQLPWLWIKMTSVLIFASTSNTKRPLCPNYTFIQTDNFSVAQQGPQRKRRFYPQNRTVCTRRVCLQNSSPSLYGYILFILNQEVPSPTPAISHQVNQNPVTWGILKHRKTHRIYRKIPIWTILLFFLHMQLTSWLL